MFIIDHLGPYGDTDALALSFSQEYKFLMTSWFYELICCYRAIFQFCQDVQYSAVVCLALLSLLLFA